MLTNIKHRMMFCLTERKKSQHGAHGQPNNLMTRSVPGKSSASASSILSPLRI